MNHRNKKYIGLVLISLFLISCGGKPLSKIDFTKGDYKLYFYSLPGQDNGQDTNSFFVKHNNFYITDNSILKNIKEDVIIEKSNRKTSYNFLYALRLVQDGEIIDGGILDVVNGEILYHNGKYEFDLRQFEKHIDGLEVLNSFEVNCVTISNTKKFFDFVDDSGDGFIFTNSEDGENPIIKFNGIVDLITDTTNVDFSSGYDGFQKRFVSDFKDLGDIAILSSNFGGGDSITLTMLWEKDYTSNLPTGYRITKQYNDTIDLPLQVYDIKKEGIISFFLENRIEGYEIIDLNE